MRNWDLLNEMNRMHRDMNDLLSSFGLGQLLGSSFETNLGLRSWPRINLREDVDHLYIEALLPGVAPDQVDMNVLGNTLTIAGERLPITTESNGLTWHRRERGLGKFLRTIELPMEVDTADIKAEYKNGLLCVTLPKATTAKPKKINIAVQ